MTKEELEERIEELEEESWGNVNFQDLPVVNNLAQELELRDLLETFCQKHGL